MPLYIEGALVQRSLFLKAGVGISSPLVYLEEQFHLIIVGSIW
jgi:hypothetical protein